MFSFFKKKQSVAVRSVTVVPRIKHANFLTAVNGVPGMTEASRPITEPLVGDLLLTYAIDLGPSYMMATSATIKEHNLGRGELRQLAEASGRAAMAQLRHRSDGTVHELTAPDNMAACAILYPEIWQKIQAAMGTPVIVAFVHRDLVLYAAADAMGKGTLTEITRQIAFEDNHALSRLLYTPAAGSWQVVASPPHPA